MAVHSYSHRSRENTNRNTRRKFLCVLVSVCACVCVCLRVNRGIARETKKESVHVRSKLLKWRQKDKSWVESDGKSVYSDPAGQHNQAASLRCLAVHCSASEACGRQLGPAGRLATTARALFASLTGFWFGASSQQWAIVLCRVCVPFQLRVRWWVDETLCVYVCVCVCARKRLHQPVPRFTAFSSTVRLRFHFA